MKNFKQKFSEYMQNISRSKRFGKFVLIVYTFLFSTSGQGYINSRLALIQILRQYDRKQTLNFSKAI